MRLKWDVPLSLQANRRLSCDLALPGAKKGEKPDGERDSDETDSTSALHHHHSGSNHVEVKPVLL